MLHFETILNVRTDARVVSVEVMMEHDCVDVFAAYEAGGND